MKKVSFTNDEGTKFDVEYSVVKGKDHHRPYGIKAALKGGEGAEDETACAENRFATEGESLAIINMLADLQVTPCTLNDIL